MIRLSAVDVINHVIFFVNITIGLFGGWWLNLAVGAVGLILTIASYRLAMRGEELLRSAGLEQKRRILPLSPWYFKVEGA